MEVGFRFIPEQPTGAVPSCWGGVVGGLVSVYLALGCRSGGSGREGVMGVGFVDRS